MEPRKAAQLATGSRNDFRKLGLDIRVVNALAAQRIFTLQDLAHVTESELATFRGIGPSTRKLLLDYLKKESPSGADQAGTISLVLPPEFITAIDDWCVAHNGRIASRAETIRRLLEIGLRTDR